MAKITLGGNEITTLGTLPEIGSKASDFVLTKGDLSDAKLSDYKGKKVILNIFPSVDTGTCAASARHFNQDVANLDNTVVLCVSRDLPFAQARFCAAEGIDRVEMLSEFKDYNFSDAYQVRITSGPLEGLHSRAIVVLDEQGIVQYVEQVPEIKDEPNYEKALAAIK
ncbi:peroxiredoxin [Flavobacteriaceae bacterium UJ101]|nr:peroxiredoxin [Flavobacteriaceae bacterium UJ101]